MKIDYDKIREAFPKKAWVYAESYDAVRIGRWDGNELAFCKGDKLDEQLLLTLRVFDKDKEIKFSGDKHRNTADAKWENLIPSLSETKYYMYGKRSKIEGGYTKLWEDRGGEIFFPAVLNFPPERVALKLGIRNFVRFSPVPVCPINEDCGYRLGNSGAGAIEIVDYAYTGFYYEDGKEVLL